MSTNLYIYVANYLQGFPKTDARDDKEGKIIENSTLNVFPMGLFLMGTNPFQALKKIFWAPRAPQRG